MVESFKCQTIASNIPPGHLGNRASTYTQRPLGRLSITSFFFPTIHVYWHLLCFRFWVHSAAQEKDGFAGMADWQRKVCMYAIVYAVT